jgi:Domain of unknown function (DUF5655)
MRVRMEAMLVERTGADVTAWNARIADRRPASEDELRTWLAEQGVTGYPAMLLGMETFGYPGFLTASADELIDSQYADRPQLRPLLDAVLAYAATLPGVEVQARKTWVTLVTPRRQFAIIRATTKSRVDLGLRLPSATVGGRLLAAPGLGNDTINVRVGMTAPDDVDDEVMDLIKRARAENL